TTTITGQLAGEGEFGGVLDPNSTFTLSFVPGPTTVGALPVDGDDWEVVPVGIASVTATITGTESGVQRIVALAQPLVPCAHPPPAPRSPPLARRGRSFPCPTPTQRRRPRPADCRSWSPGSWSPPSWSSW